jgi:hypothetical protein
MNLKPRSMYKHFLTGIFTLTSVIFALGQVDEGKAILEPISRLFTGMNLGDSAMVHSAFHHDALLFTVAQDVNGVPILKKQGLPFFLNAVGTPHSKTWNEPIWNTQVRYDGNLAQVWTNYAFYLDKTFSHCGVDAFHLFKDKTGQWKIFYLADTRQRDGCNVPPEIAASFKQ